MLAGVGWLLCCFFGHPLCTCIYIYIYMHRGKLIFFMMHLMLVPTSVNHSYTSKVYHKISAKNWPGLTPKNLWMNHRFSFIASSYWKSTVTSYQTARNMYGASEVWLKNGATLRFLFLNMRYWYCRACESACKSVSHAQTLALFHATSDRFIICWRAAIQSLRTAYNPLYTIITSCFVTWSCCLQNPKLILNSLHFLKFHTQIFSQWIQADTIKLWHQRNLPSFFFSGDLDRWITLREMWAGYT